MTLSESPNNASMSFKTCRQLIHEDFRKVLTQQPHGKISEYLYILRYLISRPLKSAHLRNIVRKQYPADFFNKPQKSPHGSFEVVCGGS